MWCGKVESMSEIKRYNVGYLGLEEHKKGRYVAHGDYLAEVKKLKAEIAKKESELAKLREGLNA